MAFSRSELYAFYDNLTLCVIPGPRSISYFAFLLLLPGALAISPSTLSHRHLASIFLPLIVACEVHAWKTSAALDVISRTVLQWSFVLLVCYDPRREFKRVWWEETVVSTGPQQNREARFLEKEQAYPNQSFTKRLAWVLTLLVSIRLTGWKVGDLSHDRRQPHLQTVSRVAFLKRAFGTILLSYILLDISACYTRVDAYFTTSMIKVDAQLPTDARKSLGRVFQYTVDYLPPRLVRSVIIASQLYSVIAGGFYPLTFPVVTLSALGFIPNEWSPHTWPCFFGPFSAIHVRGLRGLWGSWWHQMNRQINAKPGRLLSDKLGFQERSIWRKMVVTTVAFGLSGWMHMGMIPPKPKSKILTAVEMRMYLAGFFWIQPIGFAMEYFVATLLNRIGSDLRFRPMAHVLTLFWVSAWLCLTLPILTVPFRELGYWTVSPVPFSVVSRLARAGWTTSSESIVESL